MLFRVVCASLMVCLLIGCQSKSTSEACESNGVKPGTTEFDNCVESKRAEEERLQAFQRRALSNRGGGR